MVTRGRGHKSDVSPARSALLGGVEGQQPAHPSEFSFSLPPCWYLSFIISVLFQLHLAAAFRRSFRAGGGERSQGAAASDPASAPSVLLAPCTGQRDRDTRTLPRTSCCCHILLSVCDTGTTEPHNPLLPFFLSVTYFSK